ncbi:MAG: DUF58 domain-containing protein [Nitrospirae bacterium]|nr:DUF58 domain-containing protein [Nitrospirota bacterium]MBI3352855.1 DUF58 domain-containing protein [Nitrospirota bacterium]
MKPLKLSFRSRSLVVTSLGTRFIFLMLAIGIAAINTGNNLLYLLLAMMLSLVVISGILSEACLNRLRFKRFLPEAIYAGIPAHIRLVIYNDKTFVPSFSLHVKDSLEGFSDAVIRDKYFFKLPPLTFQERTYTIFFSKRGVFPLRGVSFSTRFPFGVFLKSREEEEANLTQLVVFPRTFRVSSPGKEFANRRGAPMVLRKGQSSSLHQVRSYLPGDDARFIHWKISAKKNKLMVREYEDEEEKEIAIRLSNTLGGLPSKEVLDRFEKGIELAASFSRHYIERGYQVSLFSDQNRLPPGKGSFHLKEILTFLAFLKISHQKEPLFSFREAAVPTIFISPLQPVQLNEWANFKVFRPEDIDRLAYWEPE